MSRNKKRNKRKQPELAQQRPGDMMPTPVAAQHPVEMQTEPVPTFRSSDPNLSTPQRSWLGEKFSEWVYGLSWPFWLVMGLVSVVVKSSWEAHQHSSVGEAFVTSISAVSVNTLGELGIALIVFALVSVTVEQFARQRSLQEHNERMAQVTRQHQLNLREIEDNLFRHLLGFVLNEDVLKELMLTVVAQKFFRKKLELTYEFSSCPGDGTHLLVKETLSYELHNMSNQPEVHTFLHYFENVIQHPSCKDRVTLFEITAGAETLLRWEGEEAQSKAFAYNIRRCIKTEQTIHPGKPLSVRFSHETVRRYSDSETYVTVIPADGIDVIVFVQTNVRKLEFYPDAAHRSDPKLVGGTPLPGASRRHWRIDGALLPGQGFILYWCPKISI